MQIKAGFTLTELLVVIAIMGVLGCIAYPSLQSYMIKARRGDAKVALIKAQMKQASLHILNPHYSNDKNEIGLIDSEFYTFHVISAGATTYSLQAVARIGSSQMNDTGCTTLTIDEDSNHSAPHCWN